MVALLIDYHLQLLPVCTRILLHDGRVLMEVVYAISTRRASWLACFRRETARQSGVLASVRAKHRMALYVVEVWLGLYLIMWLR